MELNNNITYQSAEIFYHIIGKGTPVMLIHGFGEDGTIWNQQAEFLKDHYQLIIPDLPGSGKSELIKDMSIEGMADVIKEIVNTELQNLSPNTGGRVMAIGHSMGGYICMALAEKYPDLVSSLALVHSSAYADSNEKKSARLKSIEFIKKNGTHEFLKTAIPGLFKPSGPPGWPEALIEKGKSFTPEALIQYYQAMINRPDRSEILKTFLHPILFIIGEHDHAVPFTLSMQQTYLADCSYIHILRNSAHMGMLEEAEKVNTALFEFLNGQPD